MIQTTTQPLPALAELRNLRQWVVANGDKKPISPLDGTPGAQTNPEKWGTFEQASAAQAKRGYKYIGFAFSPGTVDIVGLDFDDCIIGGVIAPEVMEVIKQINSYTEISPSGRGVHILCRGVLPDNIGDYHPTDNRIPSGVVPEMYDRLRWFTVTGNHVPGTPATIEPRYREVLELHRATRQRIDGHKRALVALRFQRYTPNGKDDTTVGIEALKRLAPWRADSYADWVYVGMACKSVGEQMFPHWDAFSQLSQKYKPGECEAKWRGFAPGGGLTIGSLIFWANEDDPPPPRDAGRQAASVTGTTAPPPAWDDDDPPAAEPDDNLARLFPHFSLSQGLALPEPNYLVYGAIERGDLGMTFGDAAAGKTYLAIDLAVSLAAGMPWMGRFEVQRPCQVLYFISEGRKKFFRRILAAINGMGERGADVSTIHWLVDQNLTIVTEVPQLFATDAQRYVTSYVDLYRQMGAPPVDMVFVDTLHRASVGGDENSSKDAGIVVDAITWLQKELNCAACFIHHSNKGGGYRGSTAYRGNVDFVLKVEGLHREPRTFTIDKLRDGEPDGPAEGVPHVAVFKVDEASGGTYTTWLGEDDTAAHLAKKKPDRKIERAKIAIRDLLTIEDELNQSEICRELGDVASRLTVISAIDELATGRELGIRPGARGSKVYYLLRPV